MNTPTPTPRTDAAWAQTFDANGFLSGRGNAASQMRDECATLERELTALTAERDQLRSDCENETKWAAHYLAQSISDKSRAEKAERAETVALANWNGALERAMKAEADLAADRARLDAGQILIKMPSERVWVCGVDLRAAIDAAMKEDAK